MNPHQHADGQPGQQQNPCINLPDKDLLSGKEVAAFLSRDIRTLGRYVERRIIVPIKINNRNFFLRADVLGLVQRMGGEGL